MSLKAFIQKHKVAVTAILSVVLTVVLIVTLWAILQKGGDDSSKLSPDYPPQSIDGNQKPIENDNSQKLPSSQGGGAINVTYGKDAIASLSNNTISLYYANPNASNQNVAISISIDDVVIAKSMIITPGNMITQLKLEEGISDMLALGGYDAKLTIKAYHPQTNEKAMVDTEAEIVVTVTE